MLREESCDGQQIRDDANDAKLKEIFKDLEAPVCCLILRSKNTFYWMDLRGNMVTGTVLAATDFCGFVHTLWCYPPKIQKHLMADLSPYPYVTYLDVVTEA